MKKIAILSSFAIGSLFVSSCDTLEKIASNVTSGENGSTNSLTNTEVIAGLKEALNVGIGNSVNLASITNGFLSNSKIRLPFPEDAIKVKQKAIEWGMQGQVDKFEETLNRAAEEAAKEALPIFKNAITGMSIADGFTILKGSNDAATTYLKNNTKSQLVAAFSPKVATAIDKVQLTKYWSPIVTKYNAAAPLLGFNKVNEDLNDYVTEKAIDGLFKLVAEEETKIRENVSARVTDLLKKVFGSLNK